MAPGLMRGKTERDELVEEFVAWLTPEGPPPRTRALREFALDLLAIAGDESITNDHLDTLVTRYRRRFVGPRTIVEARRVGEQLRDWCDAEDDADEVDALLAAADSQGAAVETGDVVAPTEATTAPSQPPPMKGDTLPDMAPPWDEARTEDDAFDADLARLATAADAAEVGTLPEQVNMSAPLELEIDFAGTAAGESTLRSGTLTGMGRVSDPKPKSTKKPKRISGPTLPGIGIAEDLGLVPKSTKKRPGIFRGTLPGLGLDLDSDEKLSVDDGDSPPRPKRRPSVRPGRARPARVADSVPPGSNKRPSGWTQPGVGSSPESEPPRSNPRARRRTDPGMGVVAESQPPPGPAPTHSDRPPKLELDQTMESQPSSTSADRRRASHSSPPSGRRPSSPSVPPAPSPSVPPAPNPSVPPAPSPSVPPGPSPSVPPRSGPSVPPGSSPSRTSFRPPVDGPPPNGLALVAQRLGLLGSPEQQMRAKLIAMGIAALLFMLLIFSRPGCLGAKRRQAPTTPEQPASTSVE